MSDGHIILKVNLYIYIYIYIYMYITINKNFLSFCPTYPVVVYIWASWWAIHHTPQTVSREEVS